VSSRALHGLARRWVVVVPAGFVVVDPMTVTDSILVTRRQVRAVRAVDAAEVPAGALDLRLGATTGNVLAELGEPTEIMRALRGRRGQAETGTTLAVAVVRREQLLEVLARRRVKTTPE
jgi:hypothetical protein